jgi:hypothetical protein
MTQIIDTSASTLVKGQVFISQYMADQSYSTAIAATGRITSRTTSLCTSRARPSRRAVIPSRLGAFRPSVLNRSMTRTAAP